MSPLSRSSFRFCREHCFRLTADILIASASPTEGANITIYMHKHQLPKIDKTMVSIEVTCTLSFHFIQIKHYRKLTNDILPLLRYWKHCPYLRWWRPVAAVVGRCSSAVGRCRFSNPPLHRSTVAFVSAWSNTQCTNTIHSLPFGFTLLLVSVNVSKIQRFKKRYCPLKNIL